MRETEMEVQYCYTKHKKIQKRALMRDRSLRSEKKTEKERNNDN